MNDCECGEDAVVVTLKDGESTCLRCMSIMKDPEAWVLGWYQPDAAGFPDRWHRECNDGLEVVHSKTKPDDGANDA